MTSRSRVEAQEEELKSNLRILEQGPMPKEVFQQDLEDLVHDIVSQIIRYSRITFSYICHPCTNVFPLPSKGAVDSYMF